MTIFIRSIGIGSFLLFPNKQSASLHRYQEVISDLFHILAQFSFHFFDLIPWLFSFGRRFSGCAHAFLSAFSTACLPSSKLLYQPSPSLYSLYLTAFGQSASRRRYPALACESAFWYSWYRASSSISYKVSP